MSDSFDNMPDLDWGKVRRASLSGATTKAELDKLVDLSVIQVSHGGSIEGGYLVWDSQGRTDIFVEAISTNLQSPHPGAVKIMLSNSTAIYGAQIEIEVYDN